MNDPGSDPIYTIKKSIWTEILNSAYTITFTLHRLNQTGAALWTIWIFFQCPEKKRERGNPVCRQLRYHGYHSGITL